MTRGTGAEICSLSLTIECKEKWMCKGTRVEFRWREGMEEQRPTSESSHHVSVK